MRTQIIYGLIFTLPTSLLLTCSVVAADTPLFSPENSNAIGTENFFDIVFFDNFNTDDCFPYDAKPRLSSPGGNWTEPENVQFQTFSVPASQRGGGIIDATLSSGRLDDIKPRLFACVDRECDGGSIAGNTNVDGNPARVRFQAEPGQSYEFKIEQFGNASADDYPVTYSMTINYSDRLDCWEPNDELARSRLIQPEQSVFAYMIEGFTENRLTTGSYADWYRVTLREEAFIRIEIRQPAGNHRMSLKVFDQPDDSLADVLMEGARQPEAGEPFTAISTRARAAGVYFVRVGLSLQDDNSADGEDPGPAHWMEEYEMVVDSVLEP
jgi:hypothetical protein